MMKRLRAYDDDSASAGEKEVDRATSFSSSSHHRRFFSKGPPDNGRRRLSPAVDDDRDGSSSRGLSLRNNNNSNSNNNNGSMGNSFDDRGSVMRKRVEYNDLDGFDDREGSRMMRKRDHDISDNFDDRDGFVGGRKRMEHESDGFERVHRSESFCVTRRDFPKGFRSERHWSRREDGGGSSSWRRLDGRSKKDVDDDAKSSPLERGGGGGGGGSSSSRGGMDSGGVSSSKESLRSPHGVKDGKSPTWSRDSTKDSKDSGGEHSKDTKKNESMLAESGGSATGAASGSEMEEGELQSESHQALLASERNLEIASGAKYGNNPRVYRDDGIKLDEAKSTQRGESIVANSAASGKQLVEKEDNVSSEGVVGDRKQVSVAETGNHFESSTEKLSSFQNDSVRVASACEANKGTAPKVDENAASDGVNPRAKHSGHSGFSSFSFDTNIKGKEFNKNAMDNSSTQERTRNCFDLEVGLDEPSKAIAEETRKEPESCAIAVKDKGKCVVVSSPDEACVRENNLLVERNFIACRDDAMEGPSARGFELFSSSAGVKVESVNQAGGLKTEIEKLKLEPLDLSLGLSNGAAPAASNSVAAPPSSPPHARSVQSFGTTLRTGSDCFTTSISFSGSQFMHNPSCSLTHNSVDYDFEQSVKSRPLFQGVDWQALSGNDTLPKEIAAKQKLVSNGNGNGSVGNGSIGNANGHGNGSIGNANGHGNGSIGHGSMGNVNGHGNGSMGNVNGHGNGSMGNGNGSIYFSQASLGILNGRAVQQQGVLPGMDRSASFQRQPSGKSRYQDDLRSPAHSGGSYDSRSEYVKDKKRLTGEESLSRLFRSISQRDMEQGIAGEREFVERIIYQVLSEPSETMSRKVNEMPERILTVLKDTVCEIILKEDNREKLRVLQEVLRKRSDLSLETLVKSHRVQLQILVAIKTALPDFIQRGDSIPTGDLAEIYLYLKCRNSNCRSALPVDECDCRFCSQKEGFCSSCMCLACSKFDTASNTCGWVGCDVCNHWCHTDCGLLKFYIRNDRSGTGVQGATEMQFYCLACEHPSEMFGFVKDVFKSCASDWKADTLKKELEYVRRIFSASNDIKGKMLHDVAKQLVLRLQMGATSVEVCKQIIGFLNESDSKFGNAVGSSGRESQLQPQAIEKSRGVLGDKVGALGQEPTWSKPSPMKELSRAENVGTALAMAEGSSAGGASWNSGMMMSMNKKPPVVDELDSIIKVKLAEAEMFQKRADDARRESEGLQRIVLSKNDKIEEEYASRIAKLRLSEVEERRRQKHEELQMLERSHREYFNMKTRMEMDIKDLLLKMEATRRNMCA
ncbi:hypothetical protein RND81_12G180300 [Saponaria officinalis]|uniref:Protein OBERON 4 n=1 Tax=Saponaria officinalis TaxID=3572 RepID=A0AAW1HC41_SAPOF